MRQYPGSSLLNRPLRPKRKTRHRRSRSSPWQRASIATIREQQRLAASSRQQRRADRAFWVSAEIAARFSACQRSRISRSSSATRCSSRTLVSIEPIVRLISSSLPGIVVTHLMRREILQQHEPVPQFGISRPDQDFVVCVELKNVGILLVIRINDATRLVLAMISILSSSGTARTNVSQALRPPSNVARRL